MNHPSDVPDECCPVCFGDGTIDVDDLPKLRAAQQALADVRTLDDWGRARPGRQVRLYWCHTIEHGTVFYCELSGPGICYGCGEATPEAARAKAAAWAREHLK